MSQRESAASSGIAWRRSGILKPGSAKRDPPRCVASPGPGHGGMEPQQRRRRDPGTVPEVARVLAWFSAIASMYQSPGASDSPPNLSAWARGAHRSPAATGWAEAVLLLMIPFWLQARRYLASEMSPESVQNDARLLAGALPDIVREWARRACRRRFRTPSCALNCAPSPWRPPSRSATRSRGLRPTPSSVPRSTGGRVPGRDTRDDAVTRVAGLLIPNDVPREPSDVTKRTQYLAL